MKIVMVLLLIVGLITLTCYIWPQINYREMPKGLCAGELNPKSPNWVSSLVANSDNHYVAPLKIESLSSVAEKIKQNLPQVNIVSQDQNRILAYRQSVVYHFTDWICLEANGNVTSSATMGHSDFEQNRKLVESVRQLL